MRVDLSKQMSKRDIRQPIFIFFFIVALGGFVWLFINYQNLKGQLAEVSSFEGQQELNRIETEQLVASVARHIVLPEDEQPTIATIQDIDALVGEQPVFKGAENGDKVLVYQDQAIIYSPKRDILVKVVPVYFQNDNNEVSLENEPTQAAPIQVQDALIALDIRNGSQISGAAQNLGDQLLGNPTYEVINIANAAHLDYGETILVNATGKDISALELELGVLAVPSMPEGEQLTNADVVIIIGNQ